MTQDDVMQNLNFTGAKFGDPVISHMPPEDAQKFFGKAPPDLSLEVSAKGADWVFAYLNSLLSGSEKPDRLEQHRIAQCRHAVPAVGAAG